LGLSGLFLPGCGRQLDLLKIVGKNFVYEIRHPVQAPAAKLNPFPRGNPRTHVGWIGHSTILMSFAGFSILTDPNFSNRIKIARRVVGLPIEAEEIKKLDLILISTPIMTIWTCPVLSGCPNKPCWSSRKDVKSWSMVWDFQR